MASCRHRRAAAAETHFAACPSCRAGAEAERAMRGLVREHRAQLSAQAPETLRARCVPRAAAPRTSAGPAAAAPRGFLVRRWMPLSLAATLVLAVAGVFLLGINNRAEALAASFALDHTKCFSLTNDHDTADAGTEEQAWATAQGWQVLVPRTDPAEELKLVDVRRCFSSDGKTCHMMYTWRGRPLSVYVLPRSSGDDRVVDKLGHEAAIWSANDRTYAVVADGHPQDFPHIVDYVKAHAR